MGGLDVASLDCGLTNILDAIDLLLVELLVVMTPPKSYS